MRNIWYNCILKNRTFIAFFTLCAALLAISCEDPNDIESIKRLDKQVNEVTCKVYANSYELVNLSECVAEPIVFRHDWMKTFETTNYRVQIRAVCDDPYTRLTGEIYVNGKLKKKQEANGFLTMGLWLKGENAQKDQ